MCKRCHVYGTFCNYDLQYSDLQPLEHGSGGILILQPSISLENMPIFGTLDPSPNLKEKFSPALFTTDYQFSARDLELLLSLLWAQEEISIFIELHLKVLLARHVLLRVS